MITRNLLKRRTKTSLVSKPRSMKSRRKRRPLMRRSRLLRRRSMVFRSQQLYWRRRKRIFKHQLMRSRYRMILFRKRSRWRTKRVPSKKKLLLVLKQKDRHIVRRFIFLRNRLRRFNLRTMTNQQLLQRCFRRLRTSRNRSRSPINSTTRSKPSLRHLKLPTNHSKITRKSSRKSSTLLWRATKKLLQSSKPPRTSSKENLPNWSRTTMPESSKASRTH